MKVQAAIVLALVRSAWAWSPFVNSIIKGPTKLKNIEKHPFGASTLVLARGSLPLLQMVRDKRKMELRQHRQMIQARSP